MTFLDESLRCIEQINTEDRHETTVYDDDKPPRKCIDDFNSSSSDF